ncbi:DsbA family protein [Ktedonobacter racemifer]|jgi:protein-disulfide isomerase|uniref:DSBA oxidoreductase n=1 Tax=Ktedonobacter racemifer DSM 44963 TaxID=485913 RepID=D6U7C6_KTERA|nr:DsbA family protein [Ktedonobacter racemifer]EFH79787.1 DSBA oxidoreductase [Ktedonobacter racemifer DSM 44963]
MIQRSGVTTLTPPVSKQDHVLGPESAPVTLVEYGDYECPYCGMAHLTVKEVLQLLGDQLRLVFRHFPLIQIHPHAERAAEAAEAAGAQGKFWAMHDTLFEHQRALDDTHLVLYATALDLDKDRFVRELAEHKYADRVIKDLLSGARSGVNGTPTFFINGLRYEGVYDLQTLLAAINAVV